jgi:two-component system cell cycle response regulator DivK
MALVLVIEDNPANMELSTLLLKKIGHTVLCAGDAESGLEMVRTNRPDLILMDIHLPGMDGLQATSLLKQDELTRDITVIALSALVMKGDEDRIRAAGCDAYISKPLDYRQFWQIIGTWLPAGDQKTVPGRNTV